MSRRYDFSIDWIYWFQVILLGVFGGGVLVLGKSAVTFLTPPTTSFTATELTLRHLSSEWLWAPVPGTHIFYELLEHHPSLTVQPLPPQPLAEPSQVPRVKPAPPLPFFGRFVPLKKDQAPNSVRLSRSQVSPPISAKRVNGQLVCAHKREKPAKSGHNKRGHIDLQCCLDPDEVPNPHCTY